MTGVGWFLAGIILGLLQVLTQLWTVNHLRPEARLRAVGWTIAGALGRWLLAAGVFLWALQQGLAAVICVLIGLWCSRLGLLILIDRYACCVRDRNF